MKFPTFNLFQLLIGVLLLFLVIFYIFERKEDSNWLFSKANDTKCKNHTSNIYDLPTECKIFNDSIKAINYSLSNFKTCLFKNAEIYHKEEHMFLRHLQSCLDQHVPIEIREFEAYDRKKDNFFSEKKWFLQLDKNFPQKQCVWLTIGIGGELAAEEQVFKQEYPECQIFGIEASEKSYGDFAKIGTIIPHAVGVEEKNASVMTIDCCKDGMKFIKKELRIRPLHQLLDEYVKSRIIHFAIFDIEGMENLLIDELVYGGKLYNEKIVFCQIDWELHFDKQYEGIGLKPNKIGTIINLVNNSQYLPIIVSPNYKYHHLTLLNIKDPVCENAFKIQDRFLNRHIC